jgi:putative transposase
VRDEELKPQALRVWQENRRVCGGDKLWTQLRREGVQVARCTVERLMRELGIPGTVRGKVVRTTFADQTVARPAGGPGRPPVPSAGAQPPLGGRPDLHQHLLRGYSYDNAFAESFHGLYKAEPIRKDGPWRGLDDVEYATLSYVDWFNQKRLHGEIGMVPPAKLEASYYALSTPAIAVGSQYTESPRNLGVHSAM